MAAILFCFIAGTLIPHASPSLQTESGAWEHPTVPFARPGVCTSASYRGITGSERQEGANGVGSGIRVGDGNGDNDGNVNGHGDGNGAGTGTGVEVNEGAQNGKKDGNEDGAGTGTGTGTGVETRRRTPDRNEDGNGDESENSSGDGNGDDDNGKGNEDRIGEGGREAKYARNRKTDVDAVREAGETRVEREKNVEKKRLVQ